MSGEPDQAKFTVAQQPVAEPKPAGLRMLLWAGFGILGFLTGWVLAVGAGFHTDYPAFDAMILMFAAPVLVILGTIVGIIVGALAHRWLQRALVHKWAIALATVCVVVFAITLGFVAHASFQTVLVSP